MNAPPAFAYEWRALAKEAHEAVQRREATFDKLTAKLGEDAADRELRVSRAIAADWRWVVTHERQAGAATADHDETIAFLEESLRRCQRLVEKEHQLLPQEARSALKTVPLHELVTRFGEPIGPFVAAHYQRDRVAALLWWQRRTGIRSIAFIVETTIEGRRRARADRKEAA